MCYRVSQVQKVDTHDTHHSFIVVYELFIAVYGLVSLFIAVCKLFIAAYRCLSRSMSCLSLFTDAYRCLLMFIDVQLTVHHCL